MRVRARRESFADCPPALQALGFSARSQTHISVGATYAVHALSVFQGAVFLQIRNDLTFPGWLPAWLFEPIEPGIPSDWICSLLEDEPQVVIGPAFVARDHAAYTAMVEQHPAAVRLFDERAASGDVERE